MDANAEKKIRSRSFQVSLPLDFGHYSSDHHLKICGILERVESKCTCTTELIYQQKSIIVAQGCVCVSAKSRSKDSYLLD